MIGYGNSMFLGASLFSAGGGGGIDPDAQAFITAASITDPTQQSAINTLVTDLKGYSIWTKMKALYPFCGGSASSHKFNLKDPRDLDVAYRLVFTGGWSHASTGATPNGVNAYADTKLTPSTTLSLNSTHVSLYSRTNTNTGVDMGLQRGTTYILNVARNSNQAYTSLNSQSIELYSNTDGRGFYLGNRQAINDSDAWKNGTKQVNSTNTTNASEFGITPIFIGAFNQLGSASGYSNKETAFASIGDGLSDTEAANFYTAVQAFQTTLGRSIGTQTVSDADAQAFVTNAGIVDQVEANAINNLVIGLKADSLWTKMKAIYPFVGGTASSNSYNLKNTAQYQITWSGGITHSSNGVLFNGVNGYGNTGFATNLFTSANDFGLSTYLRTNTSSGADIGVFAPDLRYIGANLTSYAYFGIGNTYISNANSDARGFWQVNRTSASVVKGFKNGSVFASGTTGAGTLSTQNIFIGALNQSGSINFAANRQHAFDAIHDGLTDTEAANLNTRVTTFQTSLNRNV